MCSAIFFAGEDHAGRCMNLVSILATVVIARGLTNRLIYVFPLFAPLPTALPRLVSLVSSFIFDSLALSVT
ncbi:hypothetical protein AcW1_006551 [Taiwanofungus camphoratus]|nr:hypothetical protein AcW1_006551 [Antrodia cinnamomea]